MKLNVVHVIKAALELLLFVELKVAIATRFGSLAVKHDLGLSDAVSSALEELLEVKVEEVLLGEVADVKRGDLIHLFFALLLAELRSLVVAMGSTHREVVEVLHELLLLVLLRVHGVGTNGDALLHHLRGSVAHGLHHHGGSAHHGSTWNNHLRSSHHHLSGDLLLSNGDLSLSQHLFLSFLR